MDENRIIRQVKAVIQNKPEKDLSAMGKLLITVIWVLAFVIPFVVIGILSAISGV